MEEMKLTPLSAFGDNGYTYPLIKGADLYCVPTCLEIILQSMGYNIPIDQISKWFDIVTAENAKSDIDIGIHLVESSFNRIFEHYHIPLKEKYIFINTIEEDFFVDFIHKELLNGSHILCGYSYGSLFDESELMNLGHFSIIVGSDHDTVKMVNPGPKHYGINELTDFKVYRAIRQKSAGLWIFEKV